MYSTATVGYLKVAWCIGTDKQPASGLFFLTPDPLLHPPVRHSSESAVVGTVKPPPTPLSSFRETEE